MRFYGFSRHYVLFELPGCQGWAYYAWAREHNEWSELERVSKGYIRQEIERRLRRPKTHSSKRRR